MRAIARICMHACVYVCVRARSIKDFPLRVFDSIHGGSARGTHLWFGSLSRLRFHYWGFPEIQPSRFVAFGASMWTSTFCGPTGRWLNVAFVHALNYRLRGVACPLYGHCLIFTSSSIFLKGCRDWLCVCVGGGGGGGGGRRKWSRSLFKLIYVRKFHVFGPHLRHPAPPSNCIHVYVLGGGVGGFSSPPPPNLLFLSRCVTERFYRIDTCPKYMLRYHKRLECTPLYGCSIQLYKLILHSHLFQWKNADIHTQKCKSQ